MNEMTREQIAQVYGIEEMDLPTFVAFSVQHHYLKLHWQHLFKPLLLALIENIEQGIIEEPSSGEAANPGNNQCGTTNDADDWRALEPVEER